MKFLADENFPKRSALLLREAGHDVLRATEAFAGAEDPNVLAFAGQTKRILLTFDRDFGDLIFHQKLPAPPAILYFRIDPSYPEETFEILQDVLGNFEIPGNYTVVSRRGVRQRSLPN